MELKSKLIKPFAKRISKNILKWSKTPIDDQQSIFKKLIFKARTTKFGNDHQFKSIKNHKDFKRQVPIRGYEDFKSYIELIIEGNRNILWPGLPKYFAKTSGTTSGVKYIPLTNESMPNHIRSARNALFNFVHQTQSETIFDGKLIFLSGSPKLKNTGKIPTGRLSGIVNHELPAYILSNRKPSNPTNLIEDWELKLEKIVEETINADMRMISGIPPWVQMYYERLLERSGKKSIRELFPNFRLFVHGGVNYEPYKKSLSKLMGEGIPSLETYPASEGFIAFQDQIDQPGLLLNTKSGIYFEFIRLDKFHDEFPERLSLDQVEKDVDYAVIINNNAGLWGYNIGDTVRFVSLNPYRIIVSGRVKHFISAFGEHVIAKEVEESILQIADQMEVSIIEFTVAPQVNPVDQKLPYHEWFVEFSKQPNDLAAFSKAVNDSLCKQNIYYDDLIKGNILHPLVIRPIKTNGFRDYMKTIGKLGGQNKVPRLSNDRKIADQLLPFVLG